MPSSSARPHGLRTNHQPFVHLVARSCCLPNLGTPPSRHTRAPLPETHLHLQSQHFTKSLCILARYAGAHPSHQDTRSNSSHKPGAPPFHRRAPSHKLGATPVHASTVRRAPHTRARPHPTTGCSYPHLHPKPRRIPNSVWPCPRTGASSKYAPFLSCTSTL